ncbi:MAG: glycosyl hydrolase family 18 protein [Lachnospirales bacterium]
MSDKDYNVEKENNEFIQQNQDDFIALKSKKAKKNKKVSPYPYIIFSVISLLFVVVISVVAFTLWKELPQNIVVDVNTYFQDTRQFVSVEDEYIKLDENLVIDQGEVYVPIEFVKTYIDEYIFYEANSSSVTITNDVNVIKMSTEDLTYYVNDDILELEIPIISQNDTAYLPINLIENLYDVTLKFNENTNVLSLNYTTSPSSVANVLEDVKVRYNYTTSSNLTTKLTKGEEVEVYGEYDNYTKIRTSDGLLGYIPTDKLGEKTLIESTTKSVHIPKNLRDEKITLLWDQIYQYESNKLANKQTLPVGVDIVSPTWFKFDDTKLDGTLVSLADTSYVDAIHNQGGEVWPILTDNFNSTISSTILRSPEYRENTIKQILAFCTLYKLDGINIDFEAVQATDSEYFIQFLRELYPYMKKSNLILSVDTFVPSAWSMYYNRKAIAESCDYIAVMTYDEHTGVSETTGPVASLNFVNEGILNTLEEVPKNQILMGIPFYTRIWKTYPNGTFTILNYSMDSAIDLFERNDATIVDDSVTGYKYATFDYVEDGQNIKYEAWLEDSDSIKKKLEIYEKHDIAGVALWSRDLEQDDTFEIIHDVVN